MAWEEVIASLVGAAIIIGVTQLFEWLRQKDKLDHEQKMLVKKTMMDKRLEKGEKVLNYYGRIFVQSFEYTMNYKELVEVYQKQREKTLVGEDLYKMCKILYVHEDKRELREIINECDNNPDEIIKQVDFLVSAQLASMKHDKLIGLEELHGWILYFRKEDKIIGDISDQLYQRIDSLPYLLFTNGISKSIDDASEEEIKLWDIEIFNIRMELFDRIRDVIDL